MNAKNTGIILVMSLMAYYGISYLMQIAVGINYSNSVFSIGMFFVCLSVDRYLYNRWLKEEALKTDKRRVFFSLILAFVFALTLIVGYQMKFFGMTESGFKAKGMILFRGACLSMLVLPFSDLLFVLAKKIKEYRVVEKTDNWSSKKIFFVCWGLVFVCWFPVFLAYYPAIMGYDFHRQYQEALRGFIWFNPYQPLAHTWLIWLFLNLGKVLGSYQTGMAFYSIFQMLVLSSACAYSVSVIYRLTKRKRFAFICACFYGIMPFFPILSISVTKDVLFTALFIVFICLFVERTLFVTGRKQMIVDILWVIEGIFMSLFRNNAIYAIAIFTVFFVVLIGKKKRIRALVLSLMLIVCSKLAGEIVYNALGTEIKAHEVEKYSVPIQQFARVGFYHADNLDEETYQQINTYVPAEYWNRYRPHLSDPVKDFVGAYIYSDTWDGHITDMLSTWAKVGLKYPNEYIDAFLFLTAGYWFVDDISWSQPYEVGVEFKNGALTTRSSTISEVLPEGILNKSYLPWLENKLDHVVCGNEFYEWPGISNLFKTAIYCWLAVLALVISIYNRDRKKILIISLPLTYLFTCMLGPVVHVRYVFPIMAIVPILWATLVYKGK